MKITIMKKTSAKQNQKKKVLEERKEQAIGMPWSSKPEGAWRRDGDQGGSSETGPKIKSPEDDAVLSSKEMISGKGL